MRYRPAQGTTAGATGTVEEIIYDRQLYKQMHAEMVLEGNEAMPRTFEGGWPAGCVALLRQEVLAAFAKGSQPVAVNLP